jgi:hypothetical protein
MQLYDGQPDWAALRLVPNGEISQPRGSCQQCGKSLGFGGAYRVPGLRGLFCSIACIETVLFGQRHCRWCGADLEKVYNEIGSRLCSRNCEVNYKAHVFGDRSAALGSGRRLLVLLQRKQPALYRKLAGTSVPDGRFCENRDCKRGEDGQPASLDSPPKGEPILLHSLPGPRAPAKQVLTGRFCALESLVLCGRSRNKPAGTSFSPLSLRVQVFRVTGNGYRPRAQVT